MILNSPSGGTKNKVNKCEYNSIGRATALQAVSCEFESRYSLNSKFSQEYKYGKTIACEMK